MNQPYVRPDVRAFLDMIATTGLPPIEELLAAGRRDLLSSGAPSLDVDVGELAVIRDLSVDAPHRTVHCRLFDARADRGPGPAMLFIHGGGFVVGDLDSHAAICADLARGLDLPVIAVDYRLAAEHPYPAAPHDTEAAARWVASSPEALGRDVTSLVLAGDSAGGNLAVVTALALREAPAAVPVIAQALFYPVLGRQHSYPSFEQFGQGYLLSASSMAFYDRAYAPDPNHWRGRPADAALEDLPPALVVTASLDPLRDEGRAFVGKLAAAGVPVIFREAAGNIHGFLSFRRVIPSAVNDFEGMVAALRILIAEAETNRVEASAPELSPA